MHIEINMNNPIVETYGLRRNYLLQSADDYRRHRHRVNKHLKKLRRSLNIATRDTKNYKEKEQISSITSDDYEKSSKYGEVILYQIERDLLFAEETKLLLDVNSSKSRRRFMITKYKKALANSNKLVKIVAGEKNEFVLLEMYIYVAIVQGLYYFAKKSWDKSVNHLSVARCGLQCLYRHDKVASSGDRELYNDLIDRLVDPALKVASLQESGAHNPDLTFISRGRVAELSDELGNIAPAIDIIKSIDPELVSIPTETEAQNLVNKITWRSYSADLKSSDVVKAVTKAQDAEKCIISKDLASYDNALQAYQDALDLQTQEIKRNELYVNEEDKQEGQVVLTYINYTLLMIRIQRDISILDGMPKNPHGSRTALLQQIRNSLRIIDGITESLTEIKDLPGVANDNELFENLTVLSTFSQAHKVYEIGKAYLLLRRYREALALVSKTASSVDGSPKLTIKFNGNIPDNEELDTFKAEIHSTLGKLHALSTYMSKSTDSNTSRFVIDNLNKFPEYSGDEILNRVAPLKLDITPVSVKPVLFDIGFNYINYKGEGIEVDDETSEDVEKTQPAADEESSVEDTKKPKKKGGFFGFFGH